MCASRLHQVPGGGLLTELINSEHKNSRYLPDVDLPENLVAVPKLADVVKDATLIIFCVPHQVRVSFLILKKGRLALQAANRRSSL